MKEIMGLTVLFWPLTLMAGLLLAFTFAISGTYFVTRKRKGGWKWPLGVAVALYLAVFWDHIPTVLMHKYYCENEAGFWVYKTPEQWMKENPGVMETLTTQAVPENRVEYRDDDSISTTIWNKRISSVTKQSGKQFLNLWRREDELIDTNTNEVLVRHVDFSTSQEHRKAGWSGWKVWLIKDSCDGEGKNAVLFVNFVKQYKGVSK
jgi:hypothetical protein